MSAKLFHRLASVPPVIAMCLLSAFSTLATPAQAENGFDALLEKFGKSNGEEGIYSSNGRIEAQTVDVATKYAGRIESVTAQEGDILAAGDEIAQMDTADAMAKLNAAKAAVLRANAGLTVAQATLMQAQSALSMAQTTYDRVVKLHETGTASQSTLDDATNTLNSAKASVEMAKAQIEDAKASIAAAEADQEQVQLALNDLTIKAPIRGRVLYRLHEPGEVIDSGYPVVTMLDLSNVYMNIYLPAAVIGTLSVGDEARLILDPIPDIVVPATITFISPQSQFTPKNVETQEQREDLVFRVKLSVPRALLIKYEELIKSGVRGIGFVRSQPDMDWPDHLAVNVPE
ncbi:HlyD family secretion protein [Celeribacter halophilus]|uniref:HlyD family secretion protein n=1 Tax=Celeribacter halophilus TaxID=576117 RepID=UPI003A919D7D